MNKTTMLASATALWAAPFAVAQDDHGDISATASLLPLGSALVGEIGSSADTDVFRVDLPGSATVEFRTVGQTDTQGELLDSAGGRIMSDDDAGPGENFSFEAEIDPGVYYLSVRGEPGTYAVSTRLGGNRDHGDTIESSTLLPLRGPEELASVRPQVLLATSGRIWPSADDVDVFRIDVAEDGTDVVVRTSGDLDTYAVLVDGSGTEVAADNSDGNFRIERTLDAGIYYVQVRGFDPGAYRVLASSVPASTTVPPVPPAPTEPPAAEPPAPTLSFHAPDELHVEWEWQYTAGTSDVFEIAARRAGGSWSSVCRDFGGGPSGLYDYRLIFSGVGPGATYEARYRYHPSGSCESGTPDPWSDVGSVTVPEDGGGGGGDFCRDDLTVDPGGRCDIYDTDWYFEVESSGRGCLRGGATVCSSQSIEWRTSSLVLVAARNTDDSWTIDDVEPESDAAAVAGKFRVR